jgi:hydrogenase maturation protease
MSEDKRILIVGIGSDFGDDQLGVIVAKRLVSHLPGCKVIWLKSPLDLCDHLTNIERLYLVDACRGAGPPGTIVRHDWPSLAITGVRFSGTHDLDLVAALQITERVQGLPPFVTLWCIEASAANEYVSRALSKPLSLPVAYATEKLLESIVAEVNRFPGGVVEATRHA